MPIGHNSLWYAFVTDRVHVVILPAGSQQGLGTGPSLLSPISHCSNQDGTDVLVGLSVSSYTDAAQEAKVKKNTAVQAYQYFRDICSWRLLNHDAPLMLGGPGVVVHSDESIFRHKPKVWYTCMTSVVSVIVNIFIMMSSRTIVGVHPQQVWVFGLCDTSPTPACGVMRIVTDRSAATLLPIIQQHVRSGTIVHSDEWAAYNHVQHLPSVGQHRVVNQSAFCRPGY